jgi:multidrug resistance efflux pump
LAAEAAEIRGETDAAQARLINAQAVQRRSRALAARGHAPANQTEADMAARDEAAGEVARLSARMSRIEIERKAAESGVWVQDGSSDVPYSQQRLDEIRMRGAALASEHQRVAAEASALVRQIAVETAGVLLRKTFKPRAHDNAVIWTPSGAIGETVVPGDVLVQTVDCSARFIEVTLPERHFGDISPGDPARVRLKGADETIEARVGAVLGAGAKYDHPRLAAGVFEPAPDQLRILIPLSAEALAGEPEAFCNVGRTAEVRFPLASSWSLRGLAVAGEATLSSLFGAADRSRNTMPTQGPERPAHLAFGPDR